MNEIVNSFLLAAYKFIPEKHLRQSGFTCYACGPFIKNKERARKLKVIGDSRYIYQNKLDKASFQNVKDYGNFKDLTKRTTSDKILCDTAFNVAKNLKCDPYQIDLTSMAYKW